MDLCKKIIAKTGEVKCAHCRAQNFTKQKILETIIMKRTGILIAELTMLVMMAHADLYWGSANGGYINAPRWQSGAVSQGQVILL